MCGLAGALVFSKSEFRVTEPYLTSMRDTMVHRGPDGAGTWIAPDGRVGLAHRRLSIADLSESANQPMSNEDKTLWIVFNGEIYNHAEIRAALNRLGGFQWKTDHSDTETILHAFQQWGIDCLQRFNGMFGFALWDSRVRELRLVRDRIGIKPLCYSVHNGRVTFASEIKALLQDLGQNRGVDEEALYHYLSFLASPAPRTMFQGISKVPAGCWVRIKESGEIQMRRYWDCLDHTTDLSGMSEGSICEELFSQLRTAVRLQKMSDRQTGVLSSPRSVLSEFCAQTDLFDRDEVLALFDLRVANSKDRRIWLCASRAQSSAHTSDHRVDHAGLVVAAVSAITGALTRPCRADRLQRRESPGCSVATACIERIEYPPRSRAATECI